MKKINLLSILLLLGSTIYGQKMNIDINYKAKAHVVDSIQIKAPVDKVYSLIANINEWPEWIEDVAEVHMNGKTEEGKSFIWKAKGYKMKSKFHTVRLNSDIGWTGKMWWITAIHNWHFENLPNGDTEVIVKESFGGFGSSLLKKSLKKDMKNDLIHLKKESESRSLSTAKYRSTNLL